MNEHPKPRVLLVDDEPNVLSGLRRTLSKSFEITTAEGGAAGLAALDNQGPFSVVVTDMRMPGMDGIQFLQAARAKHKDPVYVMLTGNADQDTAVRAINEGQIFRFLSKPCPTEQLEAAITASHRQYELATAERVLLRDTLAGSVKILIEAMTLSDPHLATMIASVRHDVTKLCAELHIPHDWRFELSGSFCLLGYTVMHGHVEAGHTLDALLTDEKLDQAADCAAKLLRHVPRLAPVAAAVRRQRETGPLPVSLDTPDAAARETIVARLLRFAVDFEREFARTADRAAALEKLRDSLGRYDPRLLDAAGRVFTSSPTASALAPERRSRRAVLPMRDLAPSMILDQNINTTDNRTLLAKGYELTGVTIERLKSFAKLGLIPETVAVWWHEEVPASKAA